MNEQAIKDIIESNEMLRIQIWILGGLILALFGIVVWFSKNAWEDMRKLLGEHDDRIVEVERTIAVQGKELSFLQRQRK